MRISYLLTHPIQYQTPLIRYLTDHGVDLHVIYATDITAGQYRDSGFGGEIEWDLPLLEGYEYSVLKPGTTIPSGLKGINELKSLITTKIKQTKANVIWAHGWGNAFSLAAIFSGRSLRCPILLRGETHLGSLRGSNNFLRRFLHREVVKRILKKADAIMAVGTANKQFYLAHGVPAEKIFLAPYVVDNERFHKLATRSQSAAETIRQELGIRSDQPIVLYCAKLIDVKDPGTLIRAVGQVQGCEPVLLLVGDGKLRMEMERLACSAAPGRVRFLGFKNQSELPAFYSTCDLFVLPSKFEPWGLVINEVMNAGKAVISADCVGASHDLISPGINGDRFKSGNVTDLTEKLESWLSDRTRLQSAGQASLDRIQTWGFAEVLAGLSSATQFLAGR